MCLKTSPADNKPTIVIAGGGIAGLVLALALKKNLNVTPEVFEQARKFNDGVGGAIGMYPNGLRVIRDIDPALLDTLREAGYPYLNRIWYRHDGTEVATAREAVLTPNGTDDDELAPLGIRRWKLQRALCDACDAAGIKVHFGMRIETCMETGDKVDITFANGTKRTASIVFGADGVKSKVRDAVTGPGMEEPQYTGVTCLMGASSVPRPNRGICFPSSVTTKCHMCTYPTGPNETIFQIYFPTPNENPEAWGTLSPEEEREAVTELADRLEKDGWAEQFVKPLREATKGSIVRVGLRSREPVSSWVSGGGRIVLLGDAAHPPVPYIGQGAMMAIEDAGTIAYLLGRICVDANGTFSTDKFGKATEVYEQMRIPRTRNVLGKSHELGKTQQDRANSPMYNLYREWSIKMQVLFHGTLPIMKPGATYDFQADANKVLTEAH